MSHLLAHKSVGLKKSTHGTHVKEGEEIPPSSVLADRNQQVKHITKSLLNWSKGMSAIESTKSKALSALTSSIAVPFHEGHAFLGDGGWQEALYTVRDKTKLLSDQHASLAATLDRTVVKELEGVRAEIKAHISAIEKEAGALHTELSKERATSATHLTTLQQGIDTFENSSEHMLPQHDPYLTHHIVQTQLTKQLHKENDFQAALIRFQKQQPQFEANMFKNIQSALRMYDEATQTKAKEIAQTESEIKDAIQAVDPECEWNFFAQQEGSLLDPNTPFRSVEALQFPGLNHASTKPIKEGVLERKKRFTKTYKESYYTLTPSGYLHERKSSDPKDETKPGFSLFLPECTLSAPSKESSKSHKIHIEGNKAVKSSVEGKLKSSLRFGGKEIAYSFRARTHGEMVAWHTAMDTLSRDTKTEAPVRAQPTTITPIAAAVANVGYAEPVAAPVVVGTEPISPAALKDGSQDIVVAPEAHEEEEEEEEGGSSAEEEDEAEYEARTAPSTPAVTNVHTSSPLDAHTTTTDHASHTTPTIVGQKEATDPAEILPTYSGDGTTVAEKEALMEKSNGKPGFLGGIFSGGSSATPAAAPKASTSNE